MTMSFRLNSLRATAFKRCKARLQKGSKSRSMYGAGWSSLVARRAHNPKVVGSNPTPATISSLSGTITYEAAIQAASFVGDNVGDSPSFATMP
jgi:hypothetical protein